MTTWVVGDVQGCAGELEVLLDRLGSEGFVAGRDRLWFVGDLVNRGGGDLEVLTRVKGLADAAPGYVDSVLGNHDLHLLAVASGTRKLSRKDTFGPVLESSARGELLEWLRHRPLMLRDRQLGVAVVHAGVPPQWGLDEAEARAAELEARLRSDCHGDFLAEMYGNRPARWRDDLRGAKRLRLITNYFTRMRFCTDSGKVEFRHKAAEAPPGFAAWFLHRRHDLDQRIVFGHWAARRGETGVGHAICVDTGCVWGGALTAYCVDDGRRLAVAARAYA